MELITLIEQHQFRSFDEASLQAGVEVVLRDQGWEYQREFRCGSNRFDFMLPGGIVIEVKIKGSTADLIRQLHRYSLLNEVSRLVVVTTCMRLCRVPMQLSDKPVGVALVQKL